MGRPKKYNTDEERKEAHKLSMKKWNAKKKIGKPMRVKKTDEERKEAKRLLMIKWRAKNKDKIQEYNAKWKIENPNYQAELMSRAYYVYSHTNSKGKKYIGSGNRQRPYVLKGKNRTKGWFKVFDGDCKIKILGEFTDRQDAYIEEDRIIREIGLHKLVNKKHVQFP
tara:strand:+ start:79 stop:579 length:501 start_codon:yes stop_codon:yes gene_type:complete